jgi:hypothetical protein
MLVNCRLSMAIGCQKGGVIRRSYGARTRCERLAATALSGGIEIAAVSADTSG